MPDALRAEPYLIIPLPKTNTGDGNKKKERPTIGNDVSHLTDWQLAANVGREFSVLTGDINPIHTFGPYAKLSGFKGCILHGFSSLARATESIITHRAEGDPTRLKHIEAKFTKAIVLPTTISIFDDADGHFFVGHEPGGDAYVTGAYTLHS